MTDFLTPERWHLIEPILDAALELSVEARAPFLDDACAGDTRLRAQVDTLLAGALKAGDFLERRNAVGAGLSAVPPPQHDPPTAGERVGPYRLLRELGHGGMGVVYLAERADGQFEQRVALKLIRLGLASEEILQRFLQERQILARLQHPRIARLLDGGLTSGGQPYFTMEPVDGVPITRFAEERRLSIDARLQLVLSACGALEHAHGAGVVHRDLKPANLLVNDAGELKLLDFGIAKLLQDGDDASATCAGQRLLTPEYAAPEQLRGEPVSRMTDVHGLGVVLYELLTGRHPFREEPTERPITVERRVLEVDATPPSRRVTEGAERGESVAAAVRAAAGASAAGSTRGMTPDRLRRRLRGDLDAIVQRALEKDPARRYESVGALAEDLRRHLAGRPVAARRMTATYRLRGFARRRTRELRSAAFATLLFVATAFVVVARQPDRAGGGLPRAAGAVTVPGTAQRMYEEGLRAMHQHDVHGARRLFRAAVAEDSAFALAIYHTLRAEWALALPPDNALEARLLGLTDGLPELDRLTVQGRIASVTPDPALFGLADQLLSLDPQRPEAHLFKGKAFAEEWELRRALPHLRRAVAMDSLGLRGVAADCVACDALAALLAALVHLDSLAAAEHLTREWVRHQPGSGRAWLALSEALWWREDAAASVTALRQAAALAPGNPHIPLYPAVLDIRAGAFDAADRLLREQLRAGPPDVQDEALWGLGISLRYQGRLEEALATAREHRQRVPDRREPAIAEAQILFEMGRARDAAALFDSLAALLPPAELERTPAAIGHWRSWHLTHLATARVAAGDTTGLEALADSIAVLGGLTRSGLRHRLHHHVRGLLLAARGDTAAAVRAFRRATPHPDAVASPFSRTNLELARALLALDRPQEAIAVLRPAIGWGMQAASFYATHTELHELLARAHDAAAQPDSARIHYAWVANAWRNADPAFHHRREDARNRSRAGAGPVR